MIPAFSQNKSDDDIDASCRLPLLLLFGSAMLWLSLAASLNLIASIKFHAPTLLADQPFWTYGRIRSAQDAALLYGFGIQAALGISLWLLCRLGRTLLPAHGAAIIGATFWNFGLLVGVLGIFSGDSTGLQGFELPRYATPILFSSYVLISLPALLSAWRSKTGSRTPVTLFILASIIWFLWIYLSANLLLLFVPVRGVLTASTASYYEHNLLNIVLTFAGLAVSFYFCSRRREEADPTRTQPPSPLAFFALWTLALFATWRSLPDGAPLPAWMIHLSTAGTFLTILPVLAIFLNLRLSGLKALNGDITLRFIYAGLTFWFLAKAQEIVGALPPVSSVVNFTLFTAAQKTLLLWGFFGLTTLGALHFILPRMLKTTWPSAKLAKLQFWLLFVGVLFSALPQMAGGILQGLLLNDPKNSFNEATHSMLPALRTSTVGDLLILMGLIAFLFHFGWMMARNARANEKPDEGNRAVVLTAETTTTNRGNAIYVGLFLTMSISWGVFVAVPALQLGGLTQAALVDGGKPYPLPRSGMANRGAEVYRANGCMACHTQQIRPVGMGSDLARGWGNRRTVARDFIFDEPALLGSQRIGPDLANVGARINADAILLHLYNPQSLVQGSIMPPYRYLFGKQNQKAGSPYTLTPSDDAQALAAYLLSRRVDGILYETPK